jgi:hypothetical protein
MSHLFLRFLCNRGIPQFICSTHMLGFVILSGNRVKTLKKQRRICACACMVYTFLGLFSFECDPVHYKHHAYLNLIINHEQIQPLLLVKHSKQKRMSNSRESYCTKFSAFTVSKCIYTLHSLCERSFEKEIDHIIPK